MAQYRDQRHLLESNSAAFQKQFKPGQVVQNAGIYRCLSCGDEIVVDKGCAIPQHHHEHIVLGPVIWGLLVFAQKHPG